MLGEFVISQVHSMQFLC